MQEVYRKDDLFPPDNEYNAEDIRDLSPFVFIGGEKFRPGQTFTWNLRIWDKRGPGQMQIVTKFELLGATSVVARVMDVVEEESVKYTNLRGNTGLVEGKILKVVGSEAIQNQLKEKQDNMVELALEYEPEYETKEENVLQIEDGDKYHHIFFRINEVKDH